MSQCNFSSCWEFEDVELQYTKSRRRNQWKFLSCAKAENSYYEEALRHYHIWSDGQGFPKFFVPLPTCAQVVLKSSDLPTLPNTVVHRIIGEFVGRVVDRGSAKQKKKTESEQTRHENSSLTLPNEVVTQIIGEYAQKVVDQASKKEKKKNKKGSSKANAVEVDAKKGSSSKANAVEVDAIVEPAVTTWERHLRILMSEFSMPRERAEKIMSQAEGKPHEAIRIVGDLVKHTVASLANQISNKDAIQLHVQAGWSASELRKAKQQWLAAAGIPKDMQRLVLAGKIAK